MFTFSNLGQILIKERKEKLNFADLKIDPVLLDLICKSQNNKTGINFMILTRKNRGKLSVIQSYTKYYSVMKTDRTVGRTDGLTVGQTYIICSELYIEYLLF